LNLTIAPSHQAGNLTRGQRRRLRLFELGSRALEARYARLLDEQFGTPRPPAYVCPLCFRVLGREAVLANATSQTTAILTAEDVPPKSLGGRPLVLTCGPCNHSSGRRLDANARAREHVRTLLYGKPAEPRPITLSIENTSVRGSYFVDEQGNHVFRLAAEPAANRVGASSGFTTAVFGGAQPRAFQMRFMDQYHERFYQLSWLRTAYLAWFAVLGYPFILDPALRKVREQIVDPIKALLSGFLSEDSPERPLTDRVLFLVREPSELRSVGIRVGPYTVLLPRPGDLEFYSRVKNLPGKPIAFQADGLAWPYEPTFGQARPSDEA
jgi:hypothetical protein